MKTAFLFPGQGSQFAGMGKDLYDKYDIAKQMYTKADEVLGYSLSDVCFNGTAEDLKQTRITQPAIFTHSVVIYEILKSAGIDCAAAAGHSLGEYSALYAAGVFDLATGLNLVKNRAESMNEAAEKEPGTMAAILGLDYDKVKEACEKASGEGVINPANFNSNGQIVISGAEAAVKKACEEAKSAGAKLAKMLPVSGAFHSPLMKSAEEIMGGVLEQSQMNDPQKIFVANVTGSVVETANDVKKNLKEQITSCVLWVDSIETLVKAGCDNFIEVGPGKVLSGLMKKINRDLPVDITSTLDMVEKIKDKLAS